MALTPEQIQAAREKYGIQPATQLPSSPATPINRQSVDTELDTAWGIKAPSAVERVQGAVQKTQRETVEKLQQRGPRVVEGITANQPIGAKAFEAAGELAGGFQDVIAGTGLAAARVFKALSPAASRVRPGDPTVGSEFIKSVASLPGMKDDIAALQKVSTWWKDLEQTDPRKAAQYRATGNIALTTLDALGLPSVLKAAEDITAKTLLRQGRETVSKIAETAIETTGKVASKLKGIPSATRQVIAPTPELIDLVAPKLTTKEMTEALATGRVKNVVSPKTKTVTPDFSGDPSTTRLVEATKNVINPQKTASENLDLVRNEIENVAENVVKPHLSENPVPFNFEDLRGSFELVSPSASVKGDATAFETYNRIKENFLETIYRKLKKAPGREAVTDFNELWDARKTVDDIIENELGAAAFESPQYVGAKAAARDFREAFSKFIVESLSSPGQMEQINRMAEFLKEFRGRGVDLVDEKQAIKLLEKEFGITRTSADEARAALFKNEMDRLSALYETSENLASKARTEQGTGAVGRFFKTKPGKTIKKVAPYVIGGGAVKLLGD
jgi:hypothetical protein